MSQINLFEVDNTDFSSVLKVYHQTEESLNEDVVTLKKWMKNQLHLPEILDDKSLQNFLLINKCSIERTKQKIETYYTIRSQIPEFFAQNELSDLKRVLNIVYLCPQPQLTEQNYRVLVFKIRNPEMLRMLDPHDVVKLALYGQEIRLKEDVLFGDIFIFDLSGPIFDYLKKITPSILDKVFTVYKKVWSMPLKGVFVINSHPFVASLLTITKTLIKPKIFERFHVCRDTKILREHFSSKILPRDYGGEGKSLEEITELMEGKMLQYEGRLHELNKFKVDENLKSEKLGNDEFLGFYAKGFNVYKKVWSMPLKSVCIVNSYPFVTSLLAIVKTLIEAKLFERFHVCPNTSILEDCFANEMLPKDYGGEEKSLEELQELLQQKIYEYKDRFVQLNTLRVNESLRPEKLENDEYLGFHGNFKTLNVD